MRGAWGGASQFEPRRMQQNGNNLGEKAAASRRAFAVPRLSARPPASPIVMKFGGTSVADAACLRHVAGIITGADADAPLIVVVSALDGVTDQLVACAADAARGQTASAARTLRALRARHDAVAAELLPPHVHRAYAAHAAALLAAAEALCRELAGSRSSPGASDEISGLGERLAAPLLASVIAAAGRRSQAIAATELISLNPEGEPNMAQSTARCRARLRPLLQRGVLPVVTGFICRRHDAAPATLGRGGSDYSATLIAACMHARETVIWTDVDGVHDADPRLVPAAQVLPALSYQDAALLARAGAKVLHPQCLEPARAAGIPVSIRNTFRPERPGTQVAAHALASRRPGAPEGPFALAARSHFALVAYRDPTGDAHARLQARAWPALANDAVAFRFLSREGILQVAVPDSQAAAVLAVWRWALRLPPGDPRLRLVPGVALVQAVGGPAGEDIHARAVAALRDAGVACLASAVAPAPEGVALAVFQPDLAVAMAALHRALLPPPAQHPPEALAAPAPAVGRGAEAVHHRIPASPLAGDNRREA